MHSVSRSSATKIECGRRRERVFLRQEPYRHRRDLRKFGEAISRNPDQHVFNEFGREAIEDRRLRCGGRNGVDGDPGFRKFFAQRLGEAKHACFGSTIGRDIRVAFFSGDR